MLFKVAKPMISPEVVGEDAKTGFSLNANVEVTKLLKSGKAVIKSEKLLARTPTTAFRM
jgi:hypothetical protein